MCPLTIEQIDEELIGLGFIPGTYIFLLKLAEMFFPERDEEGGIIWYRTSDAILVYPKK